MNKNSYEKAGWVLHMLRHELGEELFQCCVRSFYNDYKFDNALTEDFQQVVEYLSGRDFKAFFKQWFYTAGHPVISKSWKYKKRQIRLNIHQVQEYQSFSFPLEIRIEFKDGSHMDQTLDISQIEETFTLYSRKKPARIILDPETVLLFEEI